VAGGVGAVAPDPEGQERGIGERGSGDDGRAVGETQRRRGQSIKASPGIGVGIAVAVDEGPTERPHAGIEPVKAFVDQDGGEEGGRESGEEKDEGQNTAKHQTAGFHGRRS